MDFKLPHLGEGADSGTVVNLFVKEGDQVAKDQPILELENEKAVATIPSAAAGTVSKVFVKMGDKIAVGQKILSLTETGTAPVKATTKPETEAQPKGAKAETAKSLERHEEPEADSAPLEGKSETSPAAAPSLRKLARALGIDLAKVRGSARGGRIVLEDVRAYIQRLQRLAAQPPTPVASGTAPPQKPA